MVFNLTVWLFPNFVLDLLKTFINLTGDNTVATQEIQNCNKSLTFFCMIFLIRGGINLLKTFYYSNYFFFFRFLFEAVHGRFFSTSQWNRFLRRRALFDAPLTFAEMEVELCNPPSLGNFDHGNNCQQFVNLKKVFSIEILSESNKLLFRFRLGA